jgi:hypothetical protein
MQLGPSRETGWRPLLILNGSSVQTGRRILASHLSPWICTSSTDRPSRLFPDAYDLHELIGGGALDDCRCVNGEPICNDKTKNTGLRGDVRLSEAVSVSTRFPIISPSGAIINSGGKIIDRVVDGGYFETAGVSTIFDLATAILEVDATLDLRVLLITNDPNMEQTPCVPPATDTPPAPANSEGKFYEVTEISAVLSARTARSRYAGVAACKGLASRAMFARVAVTRPVVDGPTAKPRANFEGISMSWWLSKHVQLYIEGELRRGPVMGGNPNDDICTSAPDDERNDSQLCKVMRPSKKKG